MADSNSHLCIPHALRSLYEPQLNQFGITPHPNGDGWSGTGESQWGHGSAWGAPLGDSCIVFSHEICIEREMVLTESPQSAYACVCLVSEDTQATMPKMIARPRALLDGSLYSFVQPAGQFTGRLKKGGVYASRCICFLPDYFEELDAQWPGTFTGMFERFADPWDEEESRAIMTTLLGTGPQHAPGFGLLLRARVEQMIATLAAAESRKRTARQHLANRKADGLALEAQMAIERMIDEGRAPAVGEIAQRLFVSRSHLCAQFDKETGQSIGHYAKARRIERAKTLLANGESVGIVAARLGWPRCSAFSQAFKQATGVSPSEWRNL